MAVKPKDAASLLIHRQSDGGHEVLMGRRPVKSRFMPNVFVFPGGAVDPCDARVKPATSLMSDFAKYMAVAGSKARAQTMAVAAVRETFEETGVLIGQPGNPGTVKDATWQTLASQNMSADLSALQYFARATTPADQPIRFHARFFVCNWTSVANHEQAELKQNDELLDLQWVPINNPESLPLRTITRFMLDELSTWLTEPDAWQGYPHFTQKAGQRWVQRTR